MESILIVFRRDAREIRRSPALLVVVTVFALLTIGAVVGGSLIVHSVDLAEVRRLGGAAQPTVQTIVAKILEPIVGLTVYFATMLPFITLIWAFAGSLVIKEKSTGNLETLLATPLRPMTLWLAKSLAIFLPAFALAVASSLVAVVAMNVAASILQDTAVFVLPLPALVTGFLVNPLLFLGLTSLTVILAFTHDPDIAIIPSFPIGFGLMYGVPLAVATGAIDLAAWSFTLYDLGAVLLLWAAILYLSRSLTKEKIVLSARSS